MKATQARAFRALKRIEQDALNLWRKVVQFGDEYPACKEVHEYLELNGAMIYFSDMMKNLLNQEFSLPDESSAPEPKLEKKGMSITEFRAILKDVYHLGARRISGTLYEITANGNTLFCMDISLLRDEAHARTSIHRELVRVEEVATRRWQ